MNTLKKDLFIKQIPQVEVDGSTNIPTAIYYARDGNYHIGSGAYDKAPTPLDVNRDFKIDLGYHTGTKKRLVTFDTGDGARRSAFAMTQNFVDRVIEETDRWLGTRGVSSAASILIAEPLQMMQGEEDADWLKQYRKNLVDMLEGRTLTGTSRISFKNVDFLPEPFAAFQYYRYGVKHPLVTSRQQHRALVLDFGGGTFDVSVIETTKEGDIKEAGKNSLPLGSASVRVGGYFINRKLVSHLTGSVFREQNNTATLRRAIEVFEKVRAGKQDPTLLREDMQNFVTNFHRASLEMESAKIALSRQIRDWELEAHLPHSVTVSLPADFFSRAPLMRNYRLSAQEFRQVFIDAVWSHELKICLRQALDRAKSRLQELPINLVLLSGGSANIGWMQSLLRRDFSTELSQAEVLVLDDCQEVVAKGLAAECARRFATEDGDGDFGSVTYNPIYLMLDVQGDGCRPRQFVPVSSGLPVHPDSPGLLLGSAHHVAAFVGIPMQWRIKGIKSPPKAMEYFFSRSGLDVDDIEGRLNFLQTKALAPQRTNFDQELKVELLVRGEDGTAIPRFIYRVGRTPEESVDFVGVPFALDMTYAQTDRKAEAYIGLDFGTSNSSVSYVESGAVRLYQQRAEDKGWQELDELTARLPFPIAFPVLAYLGEATNAERLGAAARNAVESTLSFLTFCAYQDYTLTQAAAGRPVESRFFSGFRQNSAGPAWGLLRQLLQETPLKKGGGFTAPWLCLMEEPTYSLVNTCVSLIAQMKHDKADSGMADWKRVLHTLCNVSQSVFRTAHFGFFEDVKKAPFSGQITGYFRKANDRPPFHARIQVALAEMPPDKLPYLVLSETGLAVPLAPFLIWWPMNLPNEYDHGSLFLYDKADGNSFEFKPVGHKGSLCTSDDPAFAELAAILAQLRAQDGAPAAISVTLVD